MAKRPAKPLTYNQEVRRAVSEMADGAVPLGGLEVWLERLRNAAMQSFKPINQVQENVESYFGSIFNRVTQQKLSGDTGKRVGRFTRHHLTEEAKAELDNKIITSVSLIKFNRDIAVADTMKRVVGWYSSIPPEGIPKDQKAEAVGDIQKALKQLPYKERRVIIDQGHKLASSLNEVVCRGSGAIAAIWHSHVGQINYNFRKDHAARDGRIFLLRGSWADKEGLVKPQGKVGYTDQQTMPGEEVNCKCRYQYLFNLQDLPTEMLTKKGLEVLAKLKGTQ